MYLAIVLIAVGVSCFASLMKSGLWSNTITLVNVLTAGLLATNYFEPLADYFEKEAPGGAYVWDFLAIWLIFGIAFSVLRVITDYMSQIKVRFFVPVEKVGGIVMAVWVSWIMVCFTTMTLHTAPLARSFLDGSFAPTPTARMFFGTGPDQVWLGWVHRESKGPLSRLGKPAPFDAAGEFILKYGNRREEFEGQLTLTKPKGGAASQPLQIPGR
jgi:hypothetical protein